MVLAKSRILALFHPTPSSFSPVIHKKCNVTCNLSLCMIHTAQSVCLYSFVRDDNIPISALFIRWKTPDFDPSQIRLLLYSELDGNRSILFDSKSVIKVEEKVGCLIELANSLSVSL